MLFRAYRKKKKMNEDFSTTCTRSLFAGIIAFGGKLGLAKANQMEVHQSRRVARASCVLPTYSPHAVYSTSQRHGCGHRLYVHGKGYVYHPNTSVSLCTSRTALYLSELKLRLICRAILEMHVVDEQQRRE